MYTDISEGAKIGITLIILCALIAIVFSLLTMMKNITASGSQSLQNGLDQLSDSEFQSYDQKTISGTDVLAAIKVFEGRPVSFVVVTSANQQAAGANATTWNGYVYGAYLDVQNRDTADQAGGANAGNTFKVKVNSAGGEQAAVTAPTDGIVKFKGDSFYTGVLYTSDAGSVVYNMNIKPLSVTGKSTYVRSSAKFVAELIKDPTGTKIGVCFVQQN